jgi:hypothetical protein
MRIEAKIVILLGVAALFSGCILDMDDWGSFGDAHAYEKPFHYSYALKAGGRLDIENFNGSIEIAGWDRDQIEIDGVQYGSTPEIRDSIKIDIAASPDEVRIRTIRPPEHHGNMGAKYIVKAPRKLDLDRVTSSNGSMKVDDIEGRVRLRTSNGSVRTARLRGSLDVQTSNGAVDVEELDGPATLHTTNGRVTAGGIRGALEATSSNGSIHARLVKPEPHRAVRLQTSNGGIELVMDSLDDNDIRASTNNGGITVKLPSTANARVHAHTSHNSVHTDFDLRGRVSWKKNELDGAIGNGGPTVDLTSSNGSIRLLKF